MGNVRVMFSTMVALALLEVATSSTGAANRAGGLLKGLATFMEHVLSPTVPAIPDLRKHGGAAQAAAAVQASSTTTSNTLPPDWTTRPAAPTPNQPGTAAGLSV